MKRIIIILSLFILSCMASCDCNCNFDEQYELRPINTKEYKLYVDKYASRTIKIYVYENDGQRITMYRTDNGVCNMVCEPIESKKPVKDVEESVLNQENYFDY